MRVLPIVLGSAPSLAGMFFDPHPNRSVIAKQLRVVVNSAVV
jgi:hypothetical protein